MNKNYYALIHFGGPAVSGLLLIGYPDPEAARKGAIAQLTKIIHQLRERYPGDPYGKVKRHVEYRRSLAKPWRKTKRGSPVLEMVELPDTYVAHVGYWLSSNNEDEHICNIARIGEEQPLGYCCSRLKEDLSMS